MPTIYLVRHGEVANPNEVVYADLPAFNLSDTGVIQAHATGTFLANRPIDLVLTSPLERAVATATAIARHHGISPRTDVDLIESAQYPNWSGHRWADIPILFPGQIDRYLADASTLQDAQESVTDIAERVSMPILDAISAGSGHVVAVAHQDPIQAARLWLVGRPLAELRLDPPHHASVTTLVSDGEGRWSEAEAWYPKVAHG